MRGDRAAVKGALAKLRARRSEQLIACGFLHCPTADARLTAGMIGQTSWKSARAALSVFCLLSARTSEAVDGTILASLAVFAADGQLGHEPLTALDRGDSLI